MLKGYSEEMKPHDAFLRLAQNTYRFYRMHRREVRFMDQYVNSPFCGNGAAGMDDPNAAKALWWFLPKKKGGVLKDLPQEAIDALTQGLVQSLARAEKGFSAETIRRVAETVWGAIAEGVIALRSKRLRGLKSLFVSHIHQWPASPAKC